MTDYEADTLANYALRRAHADPAFRERLMDLCRHRMTDYDPRSRAAIELQFLLDKLREIG